MDTFETWIPDSSFGLACHIFFRDYPMPFSRTRDPIREECRFRLVRTTQQVVVEENVRFATDTSRPGTAVSRELPRASNRENQSRERSRKRTLLRGFEATETVTRHRMEGTGEGENVSRLRVYRAPREHLDYWTLRVVLGPGPPSERRIFTRRPAFAFAAISFDRRVSLRGYSTVWYHRDSRLIFFIEWQLNRILPNARLIL